MIDSNYNVLTLPMRADGKYKVGDKYKNSSRRWQAQKFNGLEIKNIDYCFGVRLHFDFNEWANNVPKYRPILDKHLRVVFDEKL